jgi:hypothetical protein
VIFVTFVLVFLVLFPVAAHRYPEAAAEFQKILNHQPTRA